MCKKKPAVKFAYRYVPLYALPDAQTFIDALARSESSVILELMAHIVDPDASIACSVEAEFYSEPEIRRIKKIGEFQADEVELILKLANRMDKLNRTRVKVANDPTHNGTRLSGEKEERKQEHPIAKISSMEASRLLDRDSLWSQCGVFIDIEFSPHIEAIDGPIDQEAKDFHGAGGRAIDVGDEMAGTMRHQRAKAGFCDRGIPLALAQRDIPLALDLAAQQLGKQNIFGREGQFAVSFIRELRFYGHGQHGKPAKGIEAGFAFDGSMIETSLLEDPSQKKLFSRVHKYMAPGSSVVFEGCDTGDGAAGRAFMKAIGEIFFAPHNWGYVRANTEVTSIDPVNKIAGFRDGKPRTLMWPNDLV